jgi:repressor LexA
MKGLTDRQREILDHIAEFKETEGLSPTIREMAQHFKVSEPSIQAHIRALQRKGYVDRSSKARSLTLKRGNTPKHMAFSLSIPVLGSISAGLPLFAEENREDEIKLDPSMLPRGLGGHRLFALNVKGESMIEAGIMDGDLVIAKESTSPEIGDTVIALVDNDEATVKKLYLSDDGNVELRPCNKTMEVQVYSPDQVKIQGVVVSLLRKF